MTREQQRPLQGGQLLAGVSDAMVALCRDHLGKGPDRCKTHWAGSDMLVTMLGGGYTVAEQTLFKSGRGAAVQDLRTALQEMLAEQMRQTVEELTGRRVIALLSASHQEPDLSAEIFVLEPEDSRSPVALVAEPSD